MPALPTHAAPVRSPAWLPPKLIGVLVVAAALRVAVAVWLIGEPLYVEDEQHYDSIATSLATDGRFAFKNGSLTSIRPPMYPALVAGIYVVAGEHAYTAVRLLQAVIGTLTVYVVFLLTRRLYDERVGLVAAAICAVYPSLVFTTGLVLTETLFTLLLCLACLAMAHYVTRPSPHSIAAFGALLALGALTRSVLWLFPAPLVVFLLVCSPERDWRKRLLHVAVALGAFAVVLAPWTIRNTRLQKTFTTVDVMGGRNFMMGNYEHTPFERPWDAISTQGDEAWHVVLRKRYPDEAKGLTQGQLDKLAMKYAIDYVLAHPGETFLRDVAKFFHFWQLEREVIAGLSRGYWRSPGKVGVLTVAGLILGSYVAVMLAGLLGMFMRVPTAWQMHVFLVLVMAFICGMHTLVFGHSRYHLPLMPLLFVYAAAAWTARSDILRQWRRPAFWGAALVFGMLAASWAREILVEAGRL